MNETSVRRHFPDGHALGKRLKGGDWDPRGSWTTIVGVVGDGYPEAALRRATRKAMSWTSPGEERRALAISLSRRRSSSDAT